MIVSSHSSVKSKFFIKVLCIALLVCIALHIASLLSLPAHPVLSSLFSTGESFGWFAIVLWGLRWVFLQRESIKNFVGAPVLCPKKARVSKGQLEELRVQVQHLRLALYGTTPEKELARRRSYQFLGQPIPDLIVPAANAAMLAEFEILVRLLRHYGFPHIEQVKIARKEFVFACECVSDLALRLQQWQEACRKTRVAIEHELVAAERLQQSLSGYPHITESSDYHCLVGVLRTLKLQFESCVFDLQLRLYTQALLCDLNMLNQQVSRR